MYRIGCLLLLALLVGCGGTSALTERGPERNHFGPRITTVEAVAFSPDGKSLLVGYTVFGGDNRPAGEDKFLALWDIESGQEIREFKGHTERVTYVTFLPDGREAISASNDGTIRIWDVSSGNQLRSIRPPRIWGDMQVATSPDGMAVATTVVEKISPGRNAVCVRLWDVSTGQLLRQFETDSQQSVGPIFFSPDGKMLMSGTTPGHEPSLRVWDVNTGNLIIEPRIMGCSGWPHRLSNDGAVLLTQRKEPDNNQVNLVLWDVATGKEIRMIDRYKIPLVARFTPDGKHLLCAVGGDMLSLMAIDSGKEVWYELHPVERLAISADGKIAVTTTQRVDHPARYRHQGVRLDLWAVKTGKHLKKLTLLKP